MNESELSGPYISNAEGWKNKVLGEDYTEQEGRFWLFYDNFVQLKPRQGWKIHVSARHNKGREVVQSVADYLQENSIDHKFMDTPSSLKTAKGNQKYKLVAIYPSFDEKKKDDITWQPPGSDEDPLQYFEPGSRELNTRSINSNTETASDIIENLLEELEDDNLLYGPEIKGGGEEFQVGSTRLNYRYAVFLPDGWIKHSETEYERLEGYELVGPEGEIIGDKDYPQPPESAEHPL